MKKARKFFIQVGLPFHCVCAHLHAPFRLLLRIGIIRFVYMHSLDLKALCCYILLEMLTKQSRRLQFTFLS